MNFKDTFVELTKYTIPHGHEDSIAHLLPKGVKKDGIGNYYISIGESETLFTTHLDTCSTKKQKVNHIIQGNIIKTDGTTILGGDNKAGVTILLYLISKGVKGTYYFFVGEEVGCIGSEWALKNNEEFFSKFKRAIAFDRRQTGSIISKQLGDFCCSPDFVSALSKEFKNVGMSYKDDPTGVYTDTATFMYTIPECTNLSAGVWNEHYTNEYVDIALIEKIAKAAERIDWESLPSERKIIINSDDDFLQESFDNDDDLENL